MPDTCDKCGLDKTDGLEGCRCHQVADIFDSEPPGTDPREWF